MLLGAPKRAEHEPHGRHESSRQASGNHSTDLMRVHDDSKDEERRGIQRLESAGTNST
jgi:hypothetical protein